MTTNTTIDHAAAATRTTTDGTAATLQFLALDNAELLTRDIAEQLDVHSIHSQTTDPDAVWQKFQHIGRIKLTRPIFTEETEVLARDRDTGALVRIMITGAGAYRVVAGPQMPPHWIALGVIEWEAHQLPKIILAR